MTWWWLSFGDEQGWRGGCFVVGSDMKMALTQATRRGLNPGGEVVGMQMEEGIEPKREHQYHLFRTLAEAQASLGEMVKPHDVEDRPTICENCNPKPN